MRGFVGLMIMCSACGFSTGASVGGGGDDGVTADASVDGAVPGVDAPVVPVVLPLFAASNQMLYRLDLDLHTTTAVGPIAPPSGTPIDVDGLALSGTTLLGITNGGGQLITIDRQSAAVTSAVTLSPTNTWGGLTVIPAGDLGPAPVVLAGTPSDGSLYRIDPVTGAVAMIGSFGGGYQFFSDLAWVHGVGLFATLTGGDCSDVCFARLDPTTGLATAFRRNLGTNLYGMSGYRDKLWAFNNAGPVLSVNQTTGIMAIEFDPVINWTEAAQ
ncbi:MAG: hypothetical protein IPQ07_35610 [Myxococcales bacterium]|nr:hypothetical protein [Myxococcales bacterium]